MRKKEQAWNPNQLRMDLAPSHVGAGGIGSPTESGPVPVNTTRESPQWSESQLKDMASQKSKPWTPSRILPSTLPEFPPQSVPSKLKISAPIDPKRFVVINKDSRFLVCRRAAGAPLCLDVVDDCRTEHFAHQRAAYLEAGGK